LRKNACEDFSKLSGIEMLYEDFYGVEGFMKEALKSTTVFPERCERCYDLRIIKTADRAKKEGFDAFTTTLLYSKYQNHEKIISLCRYYAKQFDILFYYKDFRTGWNEGIAISKELGLYRQKYCGCILSEYERYCKKPRTKINL
jgi:predicted adenine nucleotide alpha hydrolase (AANH) superfamily ATPase